MPPKKKEIRENVFARARERAVSVSDDDGDGDAIIEDEDPHAVRIMREEAADAAALSSASSVHRGGGIRQRMAKRESADPEPVGARGGIARRVAARMADATPDAGPSNQPFNHNLRKDWAEGRKSAKQVLQDASDAKHQKAEGLGKLGKDRVLEQNAHRDLSRAIGWPEKAPELKWIDIGNGKSHPVLCPISVFEKLWDSDERRFNDTIIGERNAISALWNGLAWDTDV